MIVTQWIDGAIKPVHKGLYERRNYENGKEYGTGWSYWDGKRWSVYELDRFSAKRWKHVPSKTQDMPWRGVVKEGG